MFVYIECLQYKYNITLKCDIFVQIYKISYLFEQFRKMVLQLATAEKHMKKYIVIS